MNIVSIWLNHQKSKNVTTSSGLHYECYAAVVQVNISLSQSLANIVLSNHTVFILTHKKNFHVFLFFFVQILFQFLLYSNDVQQYTVGPKTQKNVTTVFTDGRWFSNLLQHHRSHHKPILGMVQPWCRLMGMMSSTLRHPMRLHHTQYYQRS